MFNGDGAMTGNNDVINNNKRATIRWRERQRGSEWVGETMMMQVYPRLPSCLGLHIHFLLGVMKGVNITPQFQTAQWKIIKK